MKIQPPALSFSILLALALGRHSLFAEGTPPVQLTIGLQSVYSDDYDDYLNATFDDVEGGGGWFGPQIGLNFHVNDFFSFGPAFSALFSYTEVEVFREGEDDDDEFVDSLLIPRIQGKVFFPPISEHIQLYLAGEANYNLPDTDRDGYDYDSGGVGWGALLGIKLFTSSEIEIGYISIPVDISGEDEFSSFDDDVDMGGFTVRGGWSF